MNLIVPQRGHIYRIALQPDVAVLGLVISNNIHNRAYDDCVTTAVTGKIREHGLPGSVRLGSGDPAFGFIVCRDIGMVAREEIKEDLGEVSVGTMDEVGRMLKMVLGL